MKTETFIDSLAAIQAAVRDGAKWEVMTSPLPNELWYSPIDQSVDNLNRLAFERKIRLAPKPPRYWSKPSDVPGPVCWVRGKANDRFPSMIISFDADGPVLYNAMDGQLETYLWMHAEVWEHSTNPAGPFHPCACAVEEKP